MAPEGVHMEIFALLKRMLFNWRICAFLVSLQEEVPAVQTPLLQPDSFSLHSNFSLDTEQVKGKNEERLHRLTELQQKSPSLGMLPVAEMM